MVVFLQTALEITMSASTAVCEDSGLFKLKNEVIRSPDPNCGDKKLLQHDHDRNSAGNRHTASRYPNDLPSNNREGESGKISHIRARSVLANPRG